MGTKGRVQPRSSDGGGYWRWLNVDYGTSCDGHIAGDLHVVPVHPGRPSVVCVRALTHNRDECPLCKPGTDVKDLGYQPVYRDDNVPCVLTVHPHQFESLDAMPFGRAIRWSRRSGDDAESTFVVGRMSAPDYKSVIPARMVPQSITIAIARYWKRSDLLPALLRWFGDDKPATVPPAALPVAEPEPAPAPPKRGRGRSSSRQGIIDVTGEDPGSVISDVARAMLERVKSQEKRAEKNGKHG